MLNSTQKAVLDKSEVQSGYVSNLGSETLTAYNGSTALGSWTISTRNNGTGDGNAPFLGVRTTDGDLITRLRMSNRVGGTELDYYFGIGPLTFATAPLQPVPEPITVLLFACALPFLRLYRRAESRGILSRALPALKNSRQVGASIRHSKKHWHVRCNATFLLWDIR